MKISRDFDLWMECDGKTIEVTVYDRDSDSRKEIVFPYSPGKHPEFDEALGNEIYSWAEMLMDVAEAEAENGEQ